MGIQSFDFSFHFSIMPLVVSSVVTFLIFASSCLALRCSGVDGRMRLRQDHAPKLPLPLARGRVNLIGHTRRHDWKGYHQVPRHWTFSSIVLCYAAFCYSSHDVTTLETMVWFPPTRTLCCLCYFDLPVCSEKRLQFSIVPGEVSRPSSCFWMKVCVKYRQ